MLDQQLSLQKAKYIENEIPDSLCHYTDATGLLGIVESQQIWATHRSYLNDATEIDYTFDLVENLLSILLKKNTAPNLSDKDSPVWKLRDLLHRLSYRSLRSKPDPDIYLICFCKRGDLLSQWRGYGANGSGYSIGFNGKQLKDKFSNYELVKVIYNEEDQKKIIQKVFDTTISSFEKLTEKMDIPESDELAEIHARKFEEEIIHYATFFKHPTFSEEDEWRLVVMLDEKCTSEKIDFRTSQRGLIPYIKIPSETERELPISKIIIGPTEHKLFAKNAVKMATATKYPVLEIENSKIPLQ